MSDHISKTLESENRARQYFLLFKQGNERGLTYIDEELRKSVFNFARKIIQDEFEINTIIQEAFLLIWEHRMMMMNIEHVKRFICKRVRWDCYTYLSKGAILRERTISLDHYDDKGIALAIYDPQKASEQHEEARVKEEQLKLIEKAILYLPPSRKILIELRNRGFSYKKIGTDTGQSYQRVIQEVKKSIKQIKSTTIRLKKVLDASRKMLVISVADYEIYLRPQQAKVLKLRYENNHSFSEIGNELNMTSLQVLKQHYQAINKLRRLNRPARRK